MHPIWADREETTQGGVGFIYYDAKACLVCGWWWGSCFEAWVRDEPKFSGGCGTLLNFDITDVEAPLSEIRSFIIVKYGERFRVHPQKYKEVVASVFHDLGFKVRVAAHYKNGGIDTVLDGPNDITIGVQVKQYQETIKVESIRSFLGALVLHQNTKGIFVTTSEFSKGAEKEAALASLRGIPIELIDATRFFDALKIAQIKKFNQEAFRKNLQIQVDNFMPLGNSPI